MKNKPAMVTILAGLLLVGAGCGKLGDVQTEEDLQYHSAAYAVEPLGSNQASRGIDALSPEEGDSSPLAELKQQAKALLPQLKQACKPVVQELIQQGTKPPFAGKKRKVAPGMIIKWLLSLGDQVPEPCHGLLLQAKALRQQAMAIRQGGGQPQ